MFVLQKRLQEDEKRRKNHSFTQSIKGSTFFLAWIVWLLTGTLFYAYAPEQKLGFAKGLYMAVNIGYSIGFGYPTEDYVQYQWFSSFYVIVGASFVAAALGFFADAVGQDFGNWFEQQQQRQEYENALKNGKGYFHKIKYWIVDKEEDIRAVAIWFVWVFIMITYSMVQIGWPLVEAQYFAISTCSTGGHWSIPIDSPDWMYALTAVFAALGVPLMAVAMATIARGLVSYGDIDATKATILETVTKEELDMLAKLGLENGDGVVDKAEFLVLCMVRTGTDPELLSFIANRFDELDLDKGGHLSFTEITQGAYSGTTDKHTSLSCEDEEQGRLRIAHTASEESEP